jgi:hypothetical protein
MRRIFFPNSSLISCLLSDDKLSLNFHEQLYSIREQKKKEKKKDIMIGRKEEEKEKER